MNNKATVEIVQSKLVEGTNEKALLKAADAMIPDLKGQNGFINRQPSESFPAYAVILKLTA